MIRKDGDMAGMYRQLLSIPLQSGETQSLLLGVGGIALGVYILMNTGGVVTQFRNLLESEITPAGEVRANSGVVELQGSAQPVDGTVTSPHTDTECLLYDYNKTRITEHDNDFDGEEEHRDRDHLDHQHEHVRFRVEDESGSVMVDPEGAKLSVDRDDAGGHKESTDQRIKITEHRIDVGETVHVWGQSQSNGDGVSVGDGPDVLFRVGTGDRTEAVAEAGLQTIITLLVGILSLLGGAYVLAGAAGIL
jgi:hypothetical protein